MKGTYFIHLRETINATSSNDVNKVMAMEQCRNKLGLDLNDDELRKFLAINARAGKTQLKEVNEAKVFSFENDNISKLLELTKNDVKNIKLPFKNIFIDTELRFIDITVYGLHIIEDNEGSFIRILFRPENYPIKKGTLRAIIPIIDNYDEKSTQERESYEMWRSTIQRESEEILKQKEHRKKILDFVCNFINFLNTPDVCVIEVERTKEQNAKRISKGKLPIPTIHQIRVTGELKIYLDSLESSGHINYSHRFWVRGHFRTLRDENRYGENTGTRIWIHPYIKGKGILINKDYEVKSEQLSS